MSGFRVRFLKKVLGGNGREVDVCQYSFETLANTRAEAEERAKKGSSSRELDDPRGSLPGAASGFAFLNSCAHRDPREQAADAGFERSEHRSGGGARQIGHRGEIFLTDVDLDRGGAGRRLLRFPGSLTWNARATSEDGSSRCSFPVPASPTSWSDCRVVSSP